MEPWYPELTTKALVPIQVVKDNLSRDAGYLSNENCPYPSEVKQVLLSLFEVGREDDGSSTFFGGDEDPSDVIMKEIDRIYTDALEMADALSNQTDASEKIQILKTRSQLLQKLVELKERTLNLKMMAEFQNTVIEYMDEILTKDQISDLMERLK